MFRPLLLLVAAIGLLAQSAPQLAFAQGQTIVLRTGQTGGAPGSCGTLDDCFRYFAAPGCGTALSASPFSPADFAAAQTGPFATVIAPHPSWATGLICDPDARWISSGVVPGSCLGADPSALYACAFDVTAPCTTATIEVCWVADDSLGDMIHGGPNPIGVYINGVALNASFAGGNYATETIASVSNVALLSGTNWFYAYQRDAGCAVSGLMLHATITVDPCPVSVEPTTWGRVKVLYQ